MGNAHGRVGGIDALTSMAGRAININTNVFRPDLDLHLFRLGQYDYLGGGSMNTPLSLGRRHPLDSVSTAFKLQTGIRTPATDFERDLAVATRATDTGV